MKKSRLFLISVLLVMILFVSTTVYADNQNVTVLLNEGRAAINAYQFDKAIPYYDQVLKIDPNNRIALTNKGVSLANLNKYEEAVPYFDKVLKTQPNDIDALNNKAALLMKLGKYDEAMFYFDKVLKIQPGNPIAASNKKALLNREPLDTHTTKYVARLSIVSEIQIRDSHENLIGYIEPSKIFVPDPDFLDTILDTTSEGKFNLTGNLYGFEKSVITKNDKKYEEIIISTNSIYSGNDTVASKTGYKQGNNWIYYADHDGYQLINGDHLVLTWKVARPIK